MVLIIGAIFITLLVISLTLYLKLKLTIKKRTKRAIDHAKRQNILLIEKSANLLARKNKGIKQVGGNGTLILTENGILYETWIPKSTIHIPLTHIIKAEKYKEFLGKTKFRSLLKIHFFNNSWLKDSATWNVKDLDKWTFYINKITKDL